MFQASISAGNLKGAVSAATRLVDEGKFKIDEEGIGLRAVDPADAAMVILELSSSAFEDYSAEGDSEIGLDLERLEDILGVLRSGDLVDIVLREESQLALSSDGFDYEMNLPDPSSIRKEPKIPDLDLKAEIFLDGSEFRRAIKAAQKVSDHIALKTVESLFVMETSGDSDSMRFEMGGDDLIDVESEEDSRSLFSLDYLDDMSKALNKSPEVRIRLGTDLPVMFDFELDEGIQVEYLLAPRIESA